MSARRSDAGFTMPAGSDAGFTMIEVMMALTVLAIGMLGIVALQKASVVGNQEAQQITVANNIARTWIERLQRDGARWTAPSPINPSTNIGNTAWLLNTTPGSAPTWFRPNMVTTLEPTASAAFDRNGDDISLSNATAMRDATYCVHLRLRDIYPNALVRAEVRVFWAKRSLVDTTASTWLVNGICSLTSGLDALGSDDQNFHWVYAVAAIPKATAR